MFHQDFTRLKAILFNNLSTCLFSLGNMQQADKFNDMALMEDPDYGRAHYRKVAILEKKGEYSAALNLAKHSVV